MRSIVTALALGSAPAHAFCLDTGPYCDDAGHAGITRELGFLREAAPAGRRMADGRVDRPRAARARRARHARRRRGGEVRRRVVELGGRARAGLEGRLKGFALDVYRIVDDTTDPK